ncbi:MAG: 6-phosphogluconolactonase [Amnibacterium sp.]
MHNEDLLEWCRVPVSLLAEHPGRRLPVRIVEDSASMGRLMAEELVDAVLEAAADGRVLRAIIPCGPRSWYAPFAEIVNERRVDLRALEVFHMDECLDWQARLLPRAHPFSFRGVMEELFYGPIDPALAVPQAQRHWLEPGTIEEVEALLDAQPADLALGGWGQDGHVAYNQARRNPYSPLSVEELRRSTIRIQENNTDTVIALGQRDLGGAFELAPPMSVTLGMRQILGAKRIRLFSDTGAWKQTALRVALFSPEDARYPMTLLQSHPDALVTATEATADHPISRHPEWRFW